MCWLPHTGSSLSLLICCVVVIPLDGWEDFNHGSSIDEISNVRLTHLPVKRECLQADLQTARNVYPVGEPLSVSARPPLSPPCIQRAGVQVGRCLAQYKQILTAAVNCRSQTGSRTHAVEWPVGSPSSRCLWGSLLWEPNSLLLGLKWPACSGNSPLDLAEGCTASQAPRLSWLGPLILPSEQLFMCVLNHGGQGEGGFGNKETEVLYEYRMAW